MDMLTGLAGQSEENESPSIPSTRATINSSENIRDSSISLNARRLKLRNTGFRAALLPARRLSPTTQQLQTDIGGFLIRNENTENTNAERPKTRYHHSPGTPGSLNILQEIRNCSQRKAAPRSPLGEFFSLADDENDDISSRNHMNTMAPRSGSIKTVKSRKSVRRAPSFQSTKYIEYLETELGATTKKLETLRSPETISGQASKIRRLEKRTQELSQHLVDWEKNFEERVNDQVFERLHGESDLRLIILTLEQTVAHKEAHVAELSKELEDTKVKLEEAEAIEATLSRRIDALTELLAKSPTRASFVPAIELPMPTRPVKPLLHRVCTSPSKYSQSLEDLDGTLQIEGGASADTEPQGYNIFSRPVSVTYSSRLSQASTSRPVSMFSTASTSTWTSADEKPATRARKSRRFAPGSAGLKPLLLATTAGIQSPIRSFETPRRDYMDAESCDEFLWEPVEDQVTSTPSLPAPQRPYSWTCSPSATRYTSILENEEMNEDASVANTTCNDNTPPVYLGSFAIKRPFQVNEESQWGSSPCPRGLSLHQELDGQLPFTSSPAVLFQPNGSPAVRQTSKHALTTTKSRQDISSDMQNGLDDSFVSEFSQTVIKHELEQYPLEQQSSHSASFSPFSTPQPHASHLTGLISVFTRKPLDLVRGILLRSWSRCSARIGQFFWRIMHLALMPRKASRSSYTLLTNCSRFPAMDSQTFCRNISQADRPLVPKEEYEKEQRGNNRLDLPKLISKLQAFNLEALSVQRHDNCSCCIEAVEEQSLKLWTNLVLTLAVAVGRAVLDGPGAMLNTNKQEPCASDSLPQDKE